MQKCERDTGQRSLEPASDGERLAVDQQLPTREMYLLAYISMLSPQVYQKENTKQLAVDCRQAQLQILIGGRKNPHNEIIFIHIRVEE